MRSSSFFLLLATLLAAYHVEYRAHAAAPSGPLIRQLSSLLRWTRASSKTPQSDGNVLQFENGYLVETVVEGNAIGVVPYRIRVSDDGELYAVDEINSNIVKITPPLSQYSRARLVAGSFQGYTGHVDGKPSDARFNHPKGVTMDDKGNVYVADTLNLAIRRIGDSGVTTIAGGKSNVAGYRDGPSEDAKFSNDFDVVYIRPTCSLLVVDRGNAALRQISLNQEDCDYQYDSLSSSDVLMVVGAVLIGYVACILHQGCGPSVFSNKMQPQASEFVLKKELMEEKPIPVVNTPKEDPGWPSFGQLLIDLSKLGLEALVGIFLYFVPSRLRPRAKKKGLVPLKDSLQMPEDEADPQLVQRQRTPAPLSETRQVHTPIEKRSETKPVKLKSSSVKDPSLSSKHRSSKRQEYAEFYGSGEVPPYSKIKSHKERTRHRQRDKSGEAVYGATGVEQKPAEMKPVDYEKAKYERYNIRGKYGSDDSFRF
ncbi:uncharacterized protein LOC115754717 isoform X2 [Rhodamnia argentea]|uniref:Uncharacterized protein LOC115754717 isoform X2 n=1 Tax=Rhodamnia argentea TaxID=178133 RepID=A0A8B8QR85_9MYRT|nr:uncharacterized protein LOC115754717 isoform X2 [Rhodamnia argentea]